MTVVVMVLMTATTTYVDDNDNDRDDDDDDDGAYHCNKKGHKKHCCDYSSVLRRNKAGSLPDCRTNIGEATISPSGAKRRRL